MADNGPEKPTGTAGPGDVLNLVYFVADVHAACLLPFLRTGFGVEAFRWNGVLALVLLLTLAGSVPGMGWYFAAWVTAVVLQRARTMRLVYRGAVIHSRYMGYPWAAMRVPLVKRESTATGLIEPQLCFLIGVLLCPLSVDLGTFVMAGFLTLIVRNGFEREIDRQRLQRMRDAAIEQRWYADRLRGRGTDF
ncbi:hypothetical protein [Fimbriiglobus ruber]|uniref:Uncharacterized protein n=1 Tax=Fimbriiglobus ruber TaxID=1908690 RepID=A0A225DTS7_9BACT|nr:hypothetical protein [Fimbriiglobus ruber]OWK40996.1 hypothetical protein FRUB_04888 [Fimbriiglobus ruber]